MDFGAHVDQGGSRTYQEIRRTIMKQEGPIKQDGPISQASPAVAGPDFQVSACLCKTAAQDRFFVVSALEARFGDQGHFWQQVQQQAQQQARRQTQQQAQQQ